MDGSVDLVGTGTDWLDAWPNAKNGAFLELDEEMLAKYAPVTYETVPQDDCERHPQDQLPLPSQDDMQNHDLSTVRNYPAGFLPIAIS